MPCEGCIFTYTSFLTQLGEDDVNYISLLQDHGVISNGFNCSNCGAVCRQEITSHKFRCDRSRRVGGVRTRCRFSKSMKSHTWLEGSKISIKAVCRFVAIWLTSPHPTYQVLLNEMNMSSATVVDWSNNCREICLNSLILRGDQVIGGEGVVVKIDEAKLGRRKNTMGSELEDSWILVAFERESKRCFFEPIPDRTADTLIDIILCRIAPGTTIISDSWTGYEPLRQLAQYQHLTVDHSQNFVDPISRAHTQNIERTCLEVYQDIPRIGTKQEYLAGYLAEICWKRKFEPGTRIHNFFLEVSLQFPP